MANYVRRTALTLLVGAHVLGARTGQAWPTFVAPVGGAACTETCGFNCKCAGGEGKSHTGIDFAGDAWSTKDPVTSDTPVVAPFAGTVRFAGWVPDYGGTVIIESSDGSVTALVAHLLCDAGCDDPTSDVCAKAGQVGSTCDALAVTAGQTVEAGCPDNDESHCLIGKVGPEDERQNGGYAPHIHITLRYGTYANGRESERYLDVAGTWQQTPWSGAGSRWMWNGYRRAMDGLCPFADPIAAFSTVCTTSFACGAAATKCNGKDDENSKTYIDDNLGITTCPASGSWTPMCTDDSVKERRLACVGTCGFQCTKTEAEAIRTRYEQIPDADSFKGVPCDNGGSSGAHKVYGVVIQDYCADLKCPDNSEAGKAWALVYSPTKTAAFRLKEGFWGAWKCLKDGNPAHSLGGATLLGAPTDEEHDEAIDDNCNPDSTKSSKTVQRFEHGCMWFDSQVHVHVKGKEPIADAGDRCGFVITHNPPGPEPCTDECVTTTQRCADVGHVQICGNSDPDVCTEWLTLPCGAGMTCSNDTCISAGTGGASGAGGSGGTTGSGGTGGACNASPHSSGDACNSFESTSCICTMPSCNGPGSQYCNPITHTWGACAVQPYEGMCADGLDNNCNGLTDCVDPDCLTRPECQGGAGGTGGTGGSSGTAGVGGAGGTSGSGGTGGNASGELCNGLDDNNDGQVDEGFMCTFGSPGGTCVMWCGPAGFTKCEAPACTYGTTCYPYPEQCGDTVDNDCNGTIDCADPTCFDADQDADGWTCAQGDCDDNNPNRNPGEVEICNGVDDNCSGALDEGVSQSCGYGSCAGGTQTCASGSWGYCIKNGITEPSTGYAATEDVTGRCNDGVDQDCDGLVDCNDLDCAGIDGCPPLGTGGTGGTGGVSGSGGTGGSGAFGGVGGTAGTGGGSTDASAGSGGVSTDGGAGDASIDACVPSGVEVCDGIDNDCNGSVDDLFHDGFENGTINWKQFSTGWYHDTIEPYFGSWIIRGLATDTTAPCATDLTGYMITDVDLTGATAATFEFAYRASLGSSDWLTVVVSTNAGTSWSTLFSGGWSSWNPSWSWRSFDLTPYLGSTVRFGFRLNNGCGDGQGVDWRIDEVVVRATCT